MLSSLMFVAETKEVSGVAGFVLAVAEEAFVVVVAADVLVAFVAVLVAQSGIV